MKTNGNEQKIDVIISVDAGGTSTRYSVMDQNRNVVYTVDGGSGSPAVNANAESDIINMLEEVYDKVIDEFNVKAIVIGMSGFALVDHDSYVAQLKDKFNTEIEFISDAYLALLSILQDKYENGLVVVSGTGAVINALNKGKLFRTNGWGQLLTERGSAYTTVRDFVRQMIHNNEQKGYFSPLEQKFMKHLNYNKLEDFKKLFYFNPKYVAASHARFFIEEADKGDEEAIAWLRYNGQLLGQDAVSALKRVSMDSEFAAGFRGGFISNAPYVVEGLVDTLKKSGYTPIFVKGDSDPVFGGYYLAKRKQYI